MGNVDFKGFEGIRISDAIHSNDVMALVVLALLLVFALIFRLNIPLFNNMLESVSVKEQESGIFETTKQDSVFFNLFMTTQALLLGSVLIVSVAAKYDRIKAPDGMATLLAIAGIFALLLVFYLLRVGMHAVYRKIYCKQMTNTMSFSHYHAILGLFGISLYIPALWILLIGRHLWVAFVALAVVYLLFRTLLFRRYVSSTFNENAGVMSISVHIVAQEIIPLVFLYESVMYMYNII